MSVDFKEGDLVTYMDDGFFTFHKESKYYDEIFYLRRIALNNGSCLSNPRNTHIHRMDSVKKVTKEWLEARRDRIKEKADEDFERCLYLLLETEGNNVSTQSS